MTGTQARKQRTSAQTREHVLDVAADLFYWHGIRATGIDQVAADAGVAPTTLYRLFASKDDLVGSYVERSGLRYREWVQAVTRAPGRSPAEAILALFEELDAQIQPAVCRGCPFVMTLAEFPDRDSAPHRHAVAIKQWVRAHLGELCEELGAADPAVLADQLTLVFEGTYASVAALGADGPARNARATAAVLLGSATK